MNTPEQEPAESYTIYNEQEKIYTLLNKSHATLELLQRSMKQSDAFNQKARDYLAHSANGPVPKHSKIDR